MQKHDRRAEFHRVARACFLRNAATADVAEIILDLPEDSRSSFSGFCRTPWRQTFSSTSTSDVRAQQQLLRGMAHEQVVSILNEMSPDDRTALLEELPTPGGTTTDPFCSHRKSGALRSLCSAIRRAAWAFDDAVLRAAVDAAWTVKEIYDYIREHGQDSETLNVIYVVDDRGKLIDDIRIREFLLKPLEMKVSDLMDENFIALNVTDSQEEAVNVFRKYDRIALPVVDSRAECWLAW